MVKKVEANKGERLGDEGGTEANGNGNGNGHAPDGLDGEDAADRQAEKEEELRKREETQKKAKSRGHSTPKEVGDFAGAIRARRVVVNHFSAMYVSLLIDLSAGRLCQGSRKAVIMRVRVIRWWACRPGKSDNRP